MKALLLNSGMGTRMGVLTSDQPKCMTEIYGRETIIGRQLAQLLDAGIKEAVITVGAHENVLKEYVMGLNLPISISFVRNEIYSETNYIYSIYCAREELHDDIVMMHGDLVFEKAALDKILLCPQSCMAVSSTVQLPEKDFKAVIENDRISKVGIEFFEQALAAQPLYKLNREDWEIWLESITEFCESGELAKRKCYAENAFNVVSNRCLIYPLDMKDMLCREVDTPEDLAVVSKLVENLTQKKTSHEVFFIDKRYDELDEYVQDKGIKSLMFVCGKAVEYHPLYQHICEMESLLGIKVVRFSDFSPNPKYESVCKGVDIFNSKECDSVLALGGGSTMDVAKCIKMFAIMDHNKSYLDQNIEDNGIPLIAIPTTAGTGSEVTRYAVIYHNGKKQSVTHESCIPHAVFYDPSFLKTVSPYNRKATMLDALCHSVESYWSVKSTDKSKVYAREAMGMILENFDSYIANEDSGNITMQKASQLAGQAINITQTTAGHAMCYKLTGIFGIAHGHAAALCVDRLWSYMIEHLNDCIDKRGREYLISTLEELASFMGCNSAMEGAEKFDGILKKLELEKIDPASQDGAADKQAIIAELLDGVNPDRLVNHPVKLTREAMEEIYNDILG
ncbi:iron-containing alcohol dehydrogenase [Butyrivibrio fibrisolvens]|uniref:iron-containing alcohol dehydrogenase n=1 Tax=Butyrivibrio fibrisolvens TaxID=831 RepID=UPI0003FF3DCC|nr:iron-containing alcohol dehydrogenase [Butyrivibrio fibrisolvens]